MNWRGSSSLPPQLPSAAGYIWGFVDGRVPGHRRLRVASTNINLASSLVRADAVAAAISASAAVTSCAFADGLFTLVPASAPQTIGGDSSGRLGWLMGLLPRASATSSLPASSFVSSRVSPMAVPHLGAIWRTVAVDADDVFDRSRRLVPAGYAWGGVRVWDLELTVHRWALEALAEGWVTRGKVAVQCGSTTAASGPSETGGIVEGSVLGVSEPEWLSGSELIATVRMRIAVPEVA